MLTFDLFTARSNLRPHAFVWGNVSQIVSMTNCWNLQCVIREVKRYSFNQTFVPWGLSALPLGYIHVFNCVIFQISILKLLEQISTDFTWGLLSKGYGQFVQMVPRHWTRWPSCPYMVKSLNSFLLQNQESFGAESWYIVSLSQALPSLFKWWA